VLLSCNLGILTSWNPLGHSSPVMGLLYLFVNWCNDSRTVRASINSYQHFLHLLVRLDDIR